MIYIHQLKEWPNFKWDDVTLSPALSDVRHKQGRLLGRMDSLGFSLRTEANLETLITDVLKTSAIEGERLDPGQVRSSLSRHLGLETGGLPVPNRDVDGIVEMTLDATRNHQTPLTAERLFAWHAALFPTGYSGIRKITVGGWRSPEHGPVQVVSGPIGQEKVHFEAPTAEKVPKEMARFLEWFNNPPQSDPVLRAAIAHFWFVTIHPFEDGNGRIGRTIADMVLAYGDGHSERFYSLSNQIEVERKDYYHILETCSKGSLDITPWLEWFLECLSRAIDEADKRLGTVLYKARFWQYLSQHPVNERQRTVLNRLFGDFKGKLTTSKYAKLAKCSQDTALRDIRQLLQWGGLIQNPEGGRSTSYRLPLLEEMPR